jgi:hypothetical protein
MKGQCKHARLWAARRRRAATPRGQVQQNFSKAAYISPVIVSLPVIVSYKYRYNSAPVARIQMEFESAALHHSTLGHDANGCIDSYQGRKSIQLQMKDDVGSIIFYSI